MIFKKREKGINRNKDIDPDEIFLDSSNLPKFDTHQLEGVFEKSISKSTIIVTGIFFIIIGTVFMGRVAFLQIVEGKAYALRSENNRLKQIPIFADRGVIYDRNKELLAWNVLGDQSGDIPNRDYSILPGLSHVLGYVKSPKVDDNGFYFQEEFEGIDGIEYQYNNTLNGKNGLKIIETDALSNVISESIIAPPESGKAITLSIDSNIQTKLFEYIKSLALERGFTGGAGVILDVESGEVLALANFPEYNSGILSSGEDTAKIAEYNSNKNNHFLNRTISGVYTPGSTVKPYVAAGALKEGVVDENTKILSTGFISIPNPYFPGQETIFKDWKAQGWVDVRDALSVSSNIYFYEVGGGYKDQKGIGIQGINKYATMFGFGEITGIDLPGEERGVIPNPEWKAKNFKGEPWRVGDTYNTAIGQYGFQVTPIQLARAVAAIANGDTLPTPHLILDDKYLSETKIDIDVSYIQIVREGMRRSVTDGVAKGLATPYVKVAAKTGTAQIGASKSYLNSWVSGFFPYDSPRYSFAVVMENGPGDNTIGGLFVMRQLLDWIGTNSPDYLK